MTGQQVATTTPRDPWNVQQTDEIKPFIPSGFASVYSFAELVAHSGMAPKDMKTADQIAVAIFHGMEVGFTPMAALQSIAVINGRPSIWGDGALALIRSSGLLDDIEEYFEGGEMYLAPAEYDDKGNLVKPAVPNPDFKAVCKITRKGAKRPVMSEFSIGDALAAGLYNKEGPWRQYRKRMLKMRARAFGIRDEFTDVMRGLGIAEEVSDYEMKDITPTSEDPPAPKGDDDGKPKRTRAKKDAPANQYQGDAKADATDAEVIDADAGKSDADAGAKETASEDPPAPAETTAKVEETKPAEKKAAPRVLEEVKKPASSEDPAHAKVMAEVMDAAATNKPLREYLTTLDVHLAPANSEQSMRELWKTRKEFEKPTKSEVEVIAKLRDYHKDRCLAADKAAADPGEDPPAPSGDPKPEFDYSSFLHNLDVELGKQKTPDDVNRVYAEWTARPLNGGIITAEQEDNDLKPLWASHLERADFGG